MSRYLTTSLLVLICFVFFLSVEFGLMPSYIVDAFPSEIWGLLLVLSIIVLALVGIGILPLSEKR
jgi:hypothetical protein